MLKHTFYHRGKTFIRLQKDKAKELYLNDKETEVLGNWEWEVEEELENIRSPTLDQRYIKLNK